LDIPTRRNGRHIPAVWLEQLLRTPFLRRSATQLIHARSQTAVAAAGSAADQAAQQTTKLPPLLYVHQRELAIVSPAPSKPSSKGDDDAASSVAGSTETTTATAAAVEWVGSADATTCVIVALRCTATGRLVLTHLDGADAKQIRGFLPAKPAAAATGGGEPALRCTSLLDALNALTDADIAQGIDLHVVGGFQTHRASEDIIDASSSDSDGVKEAEEEDEEEEEEGGEEEEEDDSRDQSDGLLQVRDVLQLLHSYARADPSVRGARALDVRVRTLCVGPLNTQWKADVEADDAAQATTVAAAAAASSSAASSSQSATTAPASKQHFPRPYLTSLFLNLRSGALDGHFPLTRESRGPEMALRCVRGFMGPSELSHVYDERSGKMVLRAFTYAPLSVPGLTRMLSLSDAALLQCSSTSPLVEPASFVPDMRACYTYMRDHPRWQLAFSKGPQEKRVYERVSAAAGAKGTEDANQWRLVA
jgi:hypothetical protein